MRILTTTMCYPTPAAPEQGIFVQRRALAVREAGDIAVDVLVPRPWCPGLRRAARPVCGAGPLPATCGRMLSVPVLGWATDGWSFGQVVLAHLRRRARAGLPPYDLIDAHFEYPDGVGACLAGRRAGLPVVVTVRGKIVALSRRTLRRMQIAWMLRAVAARIAVSHSLARWVHRVAGEDLEVEVIPNGVDKHVFHPLDRYYARGQLGWSEEARYLLAVGHLQHVKGFDRLVGVLPAVRRRCGDVRLVLAGSRRGEVLFRHRLDREIRRVNRGCGMAEPVVRFVGPVPAATLNLMYNAADLLVSASRSEGWSNVISEALAAGLPVVATDVGGNGEQIVHPWLGRLVPDGRAEALADALEECLGLAWDRRRIAAHGRARDWAMVGGEVCRVFERVLRGSPAYRPGDRRVDATFPSEWNVLEEVGQ